jgi:O-methyltransferase.
MPGARRRIDEARLGARCRFLEGDFFAAIPRGFDLLVLKSVLHNWDDAACARLLASCREALDGGARVAIVERVLPPRIDGGPGERLVLRSDLNMLVGHGGRERSDEEIGALLRGAGFRMSSRTALPLGYSLVEAAPSM